MVSKYLPGKSDPVLADRLQNEPMAEPSALPHLTPAPATVPNRLPRSVQMLTRGTAVSSGVVIPNLARITSDLTSALGAHASKLSVKATNGEGLDSKDIDAIDKCVKALEKLRDIERDMTQTESGKDVTDMTDEEIRALMPHVQRMLSPFTPTQSELMSDTDDTIDTTIGHDMKRGDTPEGGGGSRGPLSTHSPTKNKNKT